MKKALAFCLMMFLAIPAIPGVANDPPGGSGAAGTTPSEETFKRKIELFGQGTPVKAVSRNSSGKVRFSGEIGEISPEGFQLKTKNRSVPFRYADLESLTYRHGKYSLVQSPDPVEARRVAIEIGIGGKATVRTRSSRHLFKGVIQSIENESLAMNVAGEPFSVKFAEVKVLEKTHMPSWGRALIITGAVVGGLMIVVGAAAASYY